MWGCGKRGRRDDAKVCGLSKGWDDASIGKTEGRVRLRMEWICIFWMLIDIKSITDIQDLG